LLEGLLEDSRGFERRAVSAPEKLADVRRPLWLPLLATGSPPLSLSLSSSSLSDVNLKSRVQARDCRFQQPRQVTLNRHIITRVLHLERRTVAGWLALITRSAYNPAIDRATTVDNGR